MENLATEHKVAGTVYRINTEKVIVSTEWTTELPERLRLVKLANTATFDRMDKAIKEVSKLLDTDSPLVNTLLGIAKPIFNNVYVSKWYTDLNESQEKAVEFCMGAETVAAIHGPPGTGKTHTLVELIYQLLTKEPHEKILITTPSNLALDNLLIRLHTLSALPPFSKLLPQSAILRIGHPARVQQEVLETTLDWKSRYGDDAAIIRDIREEIDGLLKNLAKGRKERGAIKGKERGEAWAEVKELRKDFRKRESKVIKKIIESSQVILATCHSAGSYHLNNLQFGVCIVDEATQAIEAVCWVPILKARKLILAGDPQQLPPTIKSIPDSIKNPPMMSESLSVTLFDRLEAMHPQIKRVLTTQYRMHEAIASFPNNTLYHSALISDPSVAVRTLSRHIKATPEDDLDSPVIFFDTDDCDFFERTDESDSTSNENEALIASIWAKKLAELGVEPKDIAIVTPYTAQVALIRNMLDFPEMTIGSVDGLQGQEREAIILSLVRSNRNGEVGFLKEYRRLNVAMTRAKRQLCVIGDSKTIGRAKDDKGQPLVYLNKWMKWLTDNADVRYAGDVVEEYGT